MIQTYRVPTPTGGVRGDASPNELPANCLYDAQNMIFRNGRFQSRRGASTFGPGTPGDYVIGSQVLGATSGFGLGYGGPAVSDVLVVGTKSDWRSYSGTWSSSLSGSACSPCNHWVFRVFPQGGAPYVIGCNDVDRARKYQTGTVSNLAASAPIARCAMVLAERVVLFNLQTTAGYSGAVGSTAFACSAFQDCTSGYGTELNGFLRDTPGDIVGALEAGNLIGYVYKSDAIVALIAQGASDPFRAEWRSIGNVGPANVRAILALQDGSHMFLGTDGAVYVFDGTTPRPLGGSTIQKLITKLADQDLTYLQSRAHAVYNETLNEATFFFKGRGTNVVGGITINLTSGAAWPMSWGFGAQDITAAAFEPIAQLSNKRQMMYFYGSSGTSYRENDGDFTDGGTAIPVSWKTPISDGGIPDRWKTMVDVTHLFQLGADDPDWPVSSGSDTINVAVETSDSAAIAVGASQALAVAYGSAGPFITDHRDTALQHGLSYSGSISYPISYNGAVVSVAVRGGR